MFAADFSILLLMISFPLYYWLPKSFLNIMLFIILRNKFDIDKRLIILKPFSPLLMLFFTPIAWIMLSTKEPFILYFILSIIALVVNLLFFKKYIVKCRWHNIEKWLKIIMEIHIIFDIMFFVYVFYKMVNYVEYIPHIDPYF